MTATARKPANVRSVKPPSPAYRSEHTAPNVLTVRCDVADGREHWFLLSGDRHHDNPDCDQALELRHLRQAQERGAGIIDVGDLFCAMQGKYDRRSDSSKMRPENRKGKYLDSLVSTAADFYGPFAANILVIGRGNHEQSIRDRHETDLTERLVQTINDRHGSAIQAGGYTGWVRFMFMHHNERCSRRLWYMHGYGGGGPVTLDTIQANRQMVYVENADVMVSGHCHESWAIEKMRIRLNDMGVIEQRPVHYVKVPTYKDEYRDGKQGWHVETGKPPKPTGAWWLRFRWDGTRGVRTDVMRAD